MRYRCLGRADNRRKSEILPALKSVTEQAGMRLMHLALAFPFVRPGVILIIVSSRTLTQFNEPQAGFDVRLDSAPLDQIDAFVPLGHSVEEVDRDYVSPWWLQRFAAIS